MSDSNENYFDSKMRIWQTVLILSVVTALVIGCHIAIMNIESSLYPEDGIGVASNATVFGGLTICSIFFPIVFRVFSTKTIVTIQIVCLMILIAVNVHPLWPTMMIGSLLCGLTLGFIWINNNIYLSHLSKQYALLTGQDFRACTSKFFGVLLTTVTVFVLITNLISSFVLNRSSQATIYNSSLTNVTKICGADNCPASQMFNDTIEANRAAFKKPSNSTLYIFFGVYGALTFIALLITIFFLKNFERETPKRSVMSDILSTLALNVTSLRLVLLIPFCLAQTVTLTIITADFTKSYVTCVIGIGMVGYVMAANAGGKMFSAIVFGHLVKYTGRIALIIFAETVYMVLLVSIFFWKPTAENPAMFFVVSTLWGLSEPIFIAQSNTLVMDAFGDQYVAGFASVNTWTSIGFTIAFALTNKICVSTKLYLAFGMQAIGTLSYICVEILVYMEQSKSGELKQLTVSTEHEKHNDATNKSNQKFEGLTE